MNDIDRKQIDRMVELLKIQNTEESIKLAIILNKADIIPKLYQYAYVESMYIILKKFESLEKFKKEIPYSFGDEKYILEKKSTFDAVKAFLEKSHKRQDE